MGSTPTPHLTHRIRPYMILPMNTQEKGNIGLLKAISWFHANEYAVYVPIGHSGHVDLIVAKPDKRPLRVQCKWTGKPTTASRRRAPNAQHYAIDLRGRANRLGGKWGVTMNYTKNSFDLLFASCPAGNFLIPWNSERAKHPNINLGPSNARYKLTDIATPAPHFERRMICTM